MPDQKYKRQKKYYETNLSKRMKSIIVRLYYGKDEDLIELLDSVKNKSDYIKMRLRSKTNDNDKK